MNFFTQHGRVKIDFLESASLRSLDVHPASRLHLPLQFSKDLSLPGRHWTALELEEQFITSRLSVQSEAAQAAEVAEEIANNPALLRVMTDKEVWLGCSDGLETLYSKIPSVEGRISPVMFGNT